MRVFLGMPHSGKVDFNAASAFHHPTREGSKLTVELHDSSSCAVLMNHNSLWSDAQNKYEAGEIDAVSMIHGDVAADPGWLDVLYEEMLASGADVISAVIRIKNQTGLSSTGVDDTGDPWLIRRLTMKEIAKLPVTFGDEDIGGPIVLNTGLWLAKLGPWFLDENPDGSMRFSFDFRNRIIKGRNGKRHACMLPDDWRLSREFRAAGLKLRATSAVQILHYGDAAFPNFGTPPGWETDIQNGPDAPWRIAIANGFPLDSDLAGQRAKTADGREVVIAKASIDGTTAMLYFEDGTTARMIDCKGV